MKINEILGLNEINMSPSRLKRDTQGLEATVGVEYEFLMPIPTARPKVQVSTIDELQNELSQYNNPDDVAAVIEEIQTLYEMDGSESDIIRWIGLEYKTMRGLVSHFGLNPPPKPLTTMDHINRAAGEFELISGERPLVSDEYHGAGRGDSWALEPDKSVQGGPDQLGLELISPPRPWSQARDDYGRVVKFMKRIGAETNKTCGLHINISFPGKSMDQLDLVKLILLSGDSSVLAQFGRVANDHARDSLIKLKNGLVNVGPSEASRLLDLASRPGLIAAAAGMISSPKTHKKDSIHLHDDYVEFRSPGGDWLNRSADEIISTANRYIVALSAAMDPNQYKTEYLSKFYKLLTKAQ